MTTRTHRSDPQKTCRRGHPRTPENLYVTPAGENQCRVCQRANRAKTGKERAVRAAAIAARDKLIRTRYMEGATYAQIAEEADVSQATIALVARTAGLSRLKDDTSTRSRCGTCKRRLEPGQALDCRSCVTDMIALWRKEQAA